MERHVVFGEDATEFRMARAACGDRTVYEWLESWINPESIELNVMVEVLEEIGRGWRSTAAADRDDLLQAVETADVLVIEREPVDQELLDHASSVLQRVVVLGTITNNIDLDACASRGIDVRTVPRPTTASIAEHVMMFLLVLARGFVGDAQVRAEDPVPPQSASAVESGGHPPTILNWKGARPPIVLRGRRLGVLGAGETARAVMRQARSFGMEVGFWSRSKHPQLEEELGARWIDLEALPGWADAVSIHLAFSPELKYIVDEGFLEKLGPEGIVVNAARGMLLDFDALERALRAGTILGAGLDVFPEEPAVPRGLFGLPNVALTPHVAAGSRWLLVDDVRAIFAAVNG